MAKICIIEPDLPTRTLLKEVVTSDGHELHLFEAPQALLGAAHSAPVSKPDLVIFGLSGLPVSEVASHTLAIKHRLDGVPILLITDGNHIQQAVESIRVGACNYLLKSNLAHDLKSFIELALDSADASQVEILFQDYPTLEELEKRYMKAVLEKTHGRKERAAKILGINRRTLYRKEREYGWVTAEEECD